MAILVSSLQTDPRLGDLVDAVDRAIGAVHLGAHPDGRVLGAPDSGDPADDPDVRRARDGKAFTAVDARGGRVLVPVVTDSGTVVVRTSVGTDRACTAACTRPGRASSPSGSSCCVAGRGGRRPARPAHERPR